MSVACPNIQHGSGRNRSSAAAGRTRFSLIVWLPEDLQLRRGLHIHHIYLAETCMGTHTPHDTPMTK